MDCGDNWMVSHLIFGRKMEWMWLTILLFTMRRLLLLVFVVIVLYATRILETFSSDLLIRGTAEVLFALPFPRHFSLS